jgi:hypothetical protein
MASKWVISQKHNPKNQKKGLYRHHITLFYKNREVVCFQNRQAKYYNNKLLRRITRLITANYAVIKLYYSNSKPATLIEIEWAPRMRYN